MRTSLGSKKQTPSKLVKTNPVKSKSADQASNNNNNNKSKSPKSKKGNKKAGSIVDGIKNLSKSGNYIVNKPNKKAQKIQSVI